MAMTERELDGQVRLIARDLGLLVYHTFDSRRSAAGFPDLVCAGRNGILFRELKANGGHISPAQKEWGLMLTRAGADYNVWWPTDLLSGRIARELAAISVLSSRKRTGNNTPTDHL
jgi:hypothetical protein